jgi:hypothetical protein
MKEGGNERRRERRKKGSSHRTTVWKKFKCHEWRKQAMELGPREIIKKKDWTKGSKLDRTRAKMEFLRAVLEASAPCLPCQLPCGTNCGFHHLFILKP